MYVSNTILVAKEKSNTFVYLKILTNYQLVRIYLSKFTHCNHITGPSVESLSNIDAEEWNYCQYCRYSHLKNPSVTSQLIYI